MVIGISGKINSGKDLIGLIIQYLISSSKDKPAEGTWTLNNFVNTSDFEIKKFADALKDMVCILLGCTREQLEDRDFKEKELGEEWWYYTDTLFYTEDRKLIPYIDASLYIKNSTNWYIIKLTPRLLLQLLGTECGREIIHPNIWVNALFADYNKGRTLKLKNATTNIDTTDKWIITDMRFPNELKAVKDRGGITIRIERGSTNTLGNPHPSETALDGATFNYVIYNNGTIDELIDKVKEILIKENII